MGRMYIGSENYTPEHEQTAQIRSTQAEPTERVVYVDRPVEIIKEVEKRVVEYVDREVEVIKTVVQEVEKEVIKEVEKIVERPYEVVRLQFQKVSEFPRWALGVMIAEAVVIAALLLK